jgi:hypothetical protein
MGWCDEWHFGLPHHRFVRSPKSPADLRFALVFFFPFLFTLLFLRSIFLCLCSSSVVWYGLILVELLFLVLVDGGGSLAASFFCSLFRSGSFITTSLVVVVAAGLLLLFRFVRRSWVLVMLLLLRL